MPIQPLIYEVEIRFFAESYDDACDKLPFLEESLNEEESWKSDTYGLELFKSGQLLRIGQGPLIGITRRYLGWKSPDTGEFANIRQEIGEEITNGIENSIILDKLGGCNIIESYTDVINELEKLGHYRFMSFNGVDKFGYHEPLELTVKVMTCPQIKYPLLIELEKTAFTEEEAKKREDELFNLSVDLRLDNLLVKKEPPTLIYESIYGNQ
ncbi:MAG: hypothetical protein JSU79_05495 [Dehalococcoidales bacterium]|nr:MAG: hypothetical protein JSU79_05495 [Dehalococcoidales bacterium]